MSLASGPATLAAPPTLSQFASTDAAVLIRKLVESVEAQNRYLSAIWMHLGTQRTFNEKTLRLMNNAIIALPAADLPAAYTVTNHTDDRTFDADTALEPEISDVLGSVIADLVTRGILRGSVT